METPIARPVEIFVDTRGAQIIEEEGSPDERDGRDIYLPNHVESVSHIAVDIGGSLAKVVYFTRTLGGGSNSSNVSPVIGSQQQLESEHFHDRLAQLQASDALHHSHLAGPSAGKAGNAWEHSRQSSYASSSPTSSIHIGSAHGLPRSPSSSNVGHDAKKSRSGTLTPTAVLRDNPMASSSYVSSMHSAFLKRRSLPSALPGGRLNFVKFETDHIDECIEFLAELIDRSAKAAGVSKEEMQRGVKLMATGGGAHMFYDKFEKELGVEVRKEDEMGCLITGLNFMTLIPEEVFCYSDELVSQLHNPLPTHEGPDGSGNGLANGSSQASSSRQDPSAPLPRPSPDPPLYAPVFDSHPSPKLPCLLVNIGSGVSIIKVDDYGKFERVSGTSLGGGTLWGLLSLLTDAESFDEMLEMSERGDNANVDMLVGDIYGSVGYNALGLKSSTIASSFGKVFRKDGSEREGAEGRKRKFKPEDICRSLLYAISNNIGQIAHMNAEKYNLDRIYFGGCFIRGHKATISTLSYAIRFWSRGTKRAFFLRHEGYLGAIGAWIKHISIAEPHLQQARPQEDSHGVLASPRSPSIESPLPVTVTAVTDTIAAPLVSPPGSAQTEPAPSSPGSALPPLPPPLSQPKDVQSSNHHQLEGVSLGDNSLPPFLAEALGSGPQKTVAMPSSSSATTLVPALTANAPPVVNGHHQRNGVSVPPTLSRIASERATKDDEVRPGTNVGQAPSQAGQDQSLEDMISALSPSDKAILAPVLKELDSLRGSAAQSLSEQSEEGSPEGQDATDIAELLAKLEAADIAADGLEGKLDELLARLDTMLESRVEEQAQVQELLVER